MSAALDLSHYVREARSQASMSREMLAQLSGLSVSTIKNIECASGSTYTMTTIRKLEDALGWRRGSYAAVRSGETPMPVKPPVTQCDTCQEIAELLAVKGIPA